MKTLKEIQTILHAHADELRERYGITHLAVFGSVVRGEAREDTTWIFLRYSIVLSV
jgi:predicted nucleotidyltransferase